MGGIWERMIRSVRQILKVLLKEQVVDDEVLTAVMPETSHILNSRPLTRNSDDPSYNESLTPNHLLQFCAPSCLPPGIFSEDDQSFRRSWRQAQYLSDMFWKRSTKQYLPLLQAWQKWNRPTRTFQEGDLVLLADEKLPRGVAHGKSSRSLSEPRWIGALGPSEDHHERIETSSFKTLPSPIFICGRCSYHWISLYVNFCCHSVIIHICYSLFMSLNIHVFITSFAVYSQMYTFYWSLCGHSSTQSVRCHLYDFALAVRPLFVNCSVNVSLEKPAGSTNFGLNWLWFETEL